MSTRWIRIVPGTALVIEDAFRRAGFPQGVMTALLISGQQAEDLIARPEVRAVTLTGSERTGAVIAARAAFDEETFGPVAAICRARDREHAIALANRTPFGLGAAIVTGDAAAAEPLAARIEAGSVFINGIVKSDPRLPFGGVKRSGYGRDSRKGKPRSHGYKSHCVHECYGPFNGCVSPFEGNQVRFIAGPPNLKGASEVAAWLRETLVVRLPLDFGEHC